jgi:hypothetical protein
MTAPAATEKTAAATRGRDGRFRRGNHFGRPATKRTPNLMKAIIANVELGLPRGDAAQCAGVTRRSVNYWAEEDPAFADELDFAESRAKRGALAVVQIGELGWQAHAWMLERRWPNEFGQKSRLDVSMEVTEYAEEQVRKLGLKSVEELMAFAEAEGLRIAPEGTHRS